MRALQLPLSLVIVIGVAGCGSDFQVPAPPDTRIDLDLAVEITATPPDMDCFNTACGGCSSWANFDGAPAKVGDPCLYKGVYQCMGTSLVCSSAACLTCSTAGKTAAGTVCGADGHTIVELTYTGATCSAYDLGSAIGMCNHGEDDKCLSHCTANGNVYNCAAVCASDDGGGTGCAHSTSETCETLAGC
ncbi:MAG TPA: hypothetical protein VGH63_18480 [Polyangia bacterium]